MWQLLCISSCDLFTNKCEVPFGHSVSLPLTNAATCPSSRLPPCCGYDQWHTKASQSPRLSHQPSCCTVVCWHHSYISFVTSFNPVIVPKCFTTRPTWGRREYCKRKQNVGHYKPHSLSRGKKGDWKEEWYVPTIILHFFHSCFLSPAGHFTMCTSWHTDLPSPHHNQLSPSNVIGPRKFSCLPFTTDTLDGLLGSLIWVT